LRSGRPAGAAEARPEEAGLVRQAQNGDAAAFGRLYDASVDRIFRYVFFRVTDTETAEDLTSEVFLKAWENLHRYRPEGPFLAWLYTIARNTVIDHYRTHKATVDLEKAGLKHDPRLDERLDLQEDVESLRGAMSSLTNEQRDVLTLRFIVELDTDQIAERMGKSEGAIRALQMRALHALAKVLERSEGTQT
jgi:RNA polymerase sigma-70 factor (ECF subfamily)